MWMGLLYFTDENNCTSLKCFCPSLTLCIARGNILYNLAQLTWVSTQCVASSRRDRIFQPLLRDNCFRSQTFWQPRHLSVSLANSMYLKIFFSPHASAWILNESGTFGFHWSQWDLGHNASDFFFSRGAKMNGGTVFNTLFLCWLNFLNFIRSSMHSSSLQKCCSWRAMVVDFHEVFMWLECLGV